MRRQTAVPIGAMVTVALVLPAAVSADTIRLKNGSTIEVEGWRDTGDAIEFAVGGGLVRILKTEVDRIDGKATVGDLPMYSAPPTVTAAPPVAVDRAAAVKQMGDLLKQGEGLALQTVLSPVEKAGGFRRLVEAWRAVEVPEGLRELHVKGQQALDLAVEAFTAEGTGTAPDAKERVEKAKSEMQAAQDELKKAAEQG